MAYEHQDYPITLFKGDETRVSDNAVEHAALKADGWQTADERGDAVAPESVSEASDDAEPSTLKKVATSLKKAAGGRKK